MPELQQLGLLMDVASSYGRGVYAGIRRCLLPRREFRLLVESPHPDTVANWRDQGVVGVVGLVNRPEVGAALQEWGVPVINVSAAIQTPFPQVGVDDEAIGRLAARYLLERHYDHFVYLGISSAGYSRRREAGFTRALAEAGKRCETFELVREENQQAELISFLQRQQQPLAIMTLGDESAMLAVQTLQAAGLTVPDPYAVLSGVYDEQICSMTRPHISGVEFPGEAIGFAAANALLDLLAGGSPPTTPMLIAPPQVVERESTAAEAIADPDVATAIAFIREHAQEPIGVQEVVDACTAGRRSLEQKFATILGCSIYQHILQIRIGAAKKLLAGSQEGLESIAKTAGFAGAQHLCEVFKRKEGITPGTFRKQWRAQHATT